MSFFCRGMISSQLLTTLWKRSSSAAGFGLLAVEQRDLFGIFARAHEIEAEIGFVALLAEIELGQRPADQCANAVPTTA